MFVNVYVKKNALTNFNNSNFTVKCYKVNSVNVNYIITINKNVMVNFYEFYTLTYSRLTIYHNRSEFYHNIHKTNIHSCL